MSSPEPDVGRWTFGLAPLDQTRAVAPVLRRLTGLVLSLEGSEPEVDALLAALEDAETRLAALAPADGRPRIGDDPPADGRAYVDHSRDVGAYNPCFPEYAISVTDDGSLASGTVTFPLAYEGPPGIVHGGFLAVFFDAVIQHHNCDAGVAGKTTTLALRYRRPTPLLTPLTFDVVRAVEGDRIVSTAKLRAADGATVLCEATMEAVAGVRANLPAVDPRRVPGGGS